MRFLKKNKLYITSEKISLIILTRKISTLTSQRCSLSTIKQQHKIATE